MTKYIDADKLLEEMEFVTTDPTCPMHIAATIDQIISLSPAADVVEVVRCKDCKYGELDDDDFPHRRFCRYNGCDWNHEYHYCGYGERGDEQ